MESERPREPFTLRERFIDPGVHFTTNFVKITDGAQAAGSS